MKVQSKEEMKKMMVVLINSLDKMTDRIKRRVASETKLIMKSKKLFCNGNKKEESSLKKRKNWHSERRTNKTNNSSFNFNLKKTRDNSRNN